MGSTIFHLLPIGLRTGRTYLIISFLYNSINIPWKYLMTARAVITAYWLVSVIRNQYRQKTKVTFHRIVHYWIKLPNINENFLAWVTIYCDPLVFGLFSIRVYLEKRGKSRKRDIKKTSNRIWFESEVRKISWSDWVRPDFRAQMLDAFHPSDT